MRRCRPTICAFCRESRVVKPKMLGVDGTFSPAQLDGLRAYVKRVAPEPPK